MADLSPFQVSVSVDIAPEPGLQELVLTGDMVSRPPGIDVVSISPSRLSIEVDEEIQKELRVRVARGGSEPSAGARWLEQATYALPRTILFRGPKSILDDLDDIFVYIDLQNRVTSFEVERSVEPIHELAQPVGPSIVTVFVAMEPAELPSLGSR
jgi:YbbR domain-containing protein